MERRDGIMGVEMVFCEVEMVLMGEGMVYVMLL